MFINQCLFSKKQYLLICLTMSMLVRFFVFLIYHLLIKNKKHFFNGFFYFFLFGGLNFQYSHNAFNHRNNDDDFKPP